MDNNRTAWKNPRTEQPKGMCVVKTSNNKFYVCEAYSENRMLRINDKGINRFILMQSIVTYCELPEIYA
jgi:hypothetical protein